MNDDLKAYVDGELPPDAAERIRATLDADPVMRWETEKLRDLGAALRSLPEPEPVGRAATLAALARRRNPVGGLLRLWAPALAGCAALLGLASVMVRPSFHGAILPTGLIRLSSAAAPAEASLPAARRTAFVRYVRSLGGEVHRNGDELRAFYPQAAHEDVKRRFEFPADLPWPTDGLRVRLMP